MLSSHPVYLPSDPVPITLKSKSYPDNTLYTWNREDVLHSQQASYLQTEVKPGQPCNPQASALIPLLAPPRHVPTGSFIVYAIA